MSEGAGNPRLQGTSRSLGAGVCLGAKREQTEVPIGQPQPSGLCLPGDSQAGRGGQAKEAGVGDAPGGVGGQGKGKRWLQPKGSVALDLNILSGSQDLTTTHSQREAALLPFSGLLGETKRLFSEKSERLQSPDQSKPS